MALLRARETRRKVQLSARLRDDRGWSDVTICDVSERGLSLRSSSAPAKGAFVEVRRGQVCVVGQIRWSHGARCGLRAQDRVPVTTILAPGADADEPTGARATAQQCERRTASRPRQALPADRAAASRRAGRLLDWTSVALAGVLAAAVVGELALTALARPADRIGAALAAAR